MAWNRYVRPSLASSEPMLPPPPPEVADATPQGQHNAEGGAHVIFCVDMVFSSLLMYSVKSGGAKGSKVQRSVDAWEHRLSRVCGHYLKGWFVIDLLSVAPSIFDILPLVQDSDSEGGSMESLKVMHNIRTLHRSPLPVEVSHVVLNLPLTLILARA